MKILVLSMVLVASALISFADEAKPAKPTQASTACCGDKTASKDKSACSAKMANCQSTPSKQALLSPKAMSIAGR